MVKMKVLLTGASGYIAGLLLPTFRERYDLTLLDVRTTDRDGNPVADVQIADLSNPDRDEYRTFFRSNDAVVHCGFVRAEDESDADARFSAEFTNVQMAYNVYQTSVEESVGRVVVASSNHAADYYEPLILDHKMDIVMPEMRPFSDNYYGWSKEAYEHLGFVFAIGKMAEGSGYNMNVLANPDESAAKVQRNPLENIQLRIGAPRETDLSNCTPGDLTRVRRALAAYISQRDLCQLFVRSIEAKDIRDEHGVPFQVFYGISGNNHAYWSITNARRVLGYEPQDNSDIRFSREVAEHIRVAKEHGDVDL